MVFIRMHGVRVKDISLITLVVIIRWWSAIDSACRACNRHVKEKRERNDDNGKKDQGVTEG